jgi:hypothetical protein
MRSELLQVQKSPVSRLGLMEAVLQLNSSQYSFPEE